MQDLVQRALEGMKTASARLSDDRDPGLGTQRAQEDVIRSLDRLLDEAAKQQKRGSKSSSGSKSGKPSKGQQGDPSEKNGQQQGDQKDDQASSSGSPKGTNNSASAGEGELPSGSRDDVAGAAGSELSESRIEWGQLPERVRELVLQGRRDRVSTLYERLTREYYRRLAEEASK